LRLFERSRPVRRMLHAKGRGGRTRGDAAVFDGRMHRYAAGMSVSALAVRPRAHRNRVDDGSESTHRREPLCGRFRGYCSACSNHQNLSASGCVRARHVVRHCVRNAHSRQISRASEKAQTYYIRVAPRWSFNFSETRWEIRNASKRHLFPIPSWDGK
jgi:hypothetical protein